MTALEKLNEVARLFADAGIEDAAREAALLIIETLGISKAALHASPPDIVDLDSAKIDSLSQRRIQGEPIQYIIGHIEFYGLKIKVGKGVLIPRPETELLVEEAVRLIREQRAYRDTPLQKSSPVKYHPLPINILDLCTGSGCIALALARQIPESHVYGIDKSHPALSYASQNAELNEISNVSFICADLFDGIDPDARFSCIVSNPPYIRKADIPGLQKEIAYEPIDALDGGVDGLDFYREILKPAPHYIEKDGFVILETGMDQADDIRKLATDAGFSDIRFLKDYAGIDRIFVGKVS